MRKKLRDVCVLLAVVATMPVWISVKLHLIRFDTMGKLLSLLPGLGGLWLRRAYYYIMLPAAPSDISVGFLSVITGRHVRLGSRVSIGDRCTINNCEIGDGTLIGSHVDIFSGRHQHATYGDKESAVSAGAELTVIGENVWIGDGAIVMSYVGANSIVGAGAVVISPVPSNCTVVGVPARPISRAD